MRLYFYHSTLPLLKKDDLGGRRHEERTSGANALITPARFGTAEAVPFVQSFSAACEASTCRSPGIEFFRSLINQ
jgi:hypothetical protein